jgi:hypothetical protein
MLRALCALVLFLLLTATSAFGQNVTAIQACDRDVAKLCSPAAPDGRLADCIEAHFQDFARSCQAALLDIATVREACAADIAQQCPATKPGAGRILICVKKHYAELSPGSRDAIGHGAKSARAER